MTGPRKAPMNAARKQEALTARLMELMAQTAQLHAERTWLVREADELQQEARWHLNEAAHLRRVICDGFES
jgi:uncharacterized coiled-coil DUF342 family protein